MKPTIVWINGAFGAGKTSVTRELCRRLPSAMPFDPEQIGFALRRLIPKPELPPDFQDHPLWRELTVSTAASFHRHFGRTLIVPMTLVNPTYFDEIVYGLRTAGFHVHHFTLLASPSTLRWRQLKRPGTPSAKLWTLRQVDRCVQGLTGPRFDTYLQTERRTVAEIAADVLSRCPGLTEPDLMTQ